MSLYLKYRPQDFDSVVAQEQVKDILKAESEKNKIYSSYIFFGPRWTGKTSMARIFAKAINCLSNDKKPCNKCENCNLINSWKTLDFVEIDAASNTQVDKIREEIIDKAVYPPVNLKKKIYIIDEVHMLSKSAFNALLKIMEEPPEYLTFILATTEIHKVPETIISRCEIFNFKRISLLKIVERLEFICKNEWFSYTKDWLELIAKISDWWLRDAIKYTEQVSIIWDINVENVSKFLWIAPEWKIKDFINILNWQDVKKIFDFVELLKEDWIDLANFVKDSLLYLNNNLLDNLDKNLTVINLLDEIYQNLKNFPSADLAYKTIIWNKFANNNLSKIKKSENTNNKESEDTNNKYEIETNSSIENDNVNTQNNTLDNDENILSKEEDLKSSILNNLDSSIVKWILERFWTIEKVDWKIIITIISKTNYNILIQPEKKQILEKAVKKVFSNANYEIIYMNKEEYFNKKLLA